MKKKNILILPLICLEPWNLECEYATACLLGTKGNHQYRSFSLVTMPVNHYKLWFWYFNETSSRLSKLENCLLSSINILLSDHLPLVFSSFKKLGGISEWWNLSSLVYVCINFPPLQHSFNNILATRIYNQKYSHKK